MAVKTCNKRCFETGGQDTEPLPDRRPTCQVTRQPLLFQPPAAHPFQQYGYNTTPPCLGCAAGGRQLTAPSCCLVCLPADPKRSTTRQSTAILRVMQPSSAAQHATDEHGAGWLLAALPAAALLPPASRLSTVTTSPAAQASCRPQPDTQQDTKYVMRADGPGRACQHAATPETMRGFCKHVGPNMYGMRVRA